jgi:glycosyltransferase involved in cell wall biosynthesis
MKIIIHNDKSSSIFFENKFYDVGVELEIPFSTAIRLSKTIDVEFFADKPEYNKDLFSKEKKFGFTSDIDQISGWGNVSFNLLKNSLAYDISLTGRLYNLLDRDIIMMARKPLLEQEAMVWHEQPNDKWDRSPFPKNIAIVPFETTIIPASWIKRINAFDALLVPCKQNLEAFRDSGVTVPIEVIHWGVDTNKFIEINRPDRDTFTFGTMGALSIRKGTDKLIQAFQEAFPPDLYPNVRLICKTSSPHYPFMVKDKRIIVQMMPVTHEELMNDFFKEIDVGVFPFRGEGFGLCPLETLATGVPVIMTGWSGAMEYYDPKCCLKLNYSMVPAKNFTETVYREECGSWSEPDLEHLKELMLWSYNNQDKVKEMGKYGAEYVRKEWKWSDKIKMFHLALTKYL